MSTAVADQEVALIDLVDRLLGGGVVIAGDITLAVADVDLVYVQLRALNSAEQAFVRPTRRSSSS